MIGFAFCHGWSFDARALAPLRMALAQRLPHAANASFDLGFNCAAHLPALTPETTWIALGHSYGFAWLLQQAQPWKAAISLNGFTRFCRRPGHPQGAPARLVDAMLARLAHDPHALVQEFHLACGMPAPAPVERDQAALLAHLACLRDLNLALPACPVLALASSEDSIVPAALSHACFAQAGCTLREFSGDHTVLLREPAAAVDAIVEFTESIHA